MRKVLGLVFLAILLMAASADLSARKNSEPDKGEKQKKIQAIVGEVKLRNLQTFPYCAVEMKGSYNQHQKAFHTLFAEANKQRVQMESAVFVVYYSDLKRAESIGASEAEEMEIPEGGCARLRRRVRRGADVKGLR